ncbi:MAG: TlpA disulfide reductase family protein [Polyangiaceae bacterium]
MRLLVLLLLGLAGVGCGPAGLPPSASSPKLNQALPSFERETIDGGKVSTSGSGRVVVVKFFAKYCEPCKKTLPEAQALHDNDRDVLVIGVAEDETQADVQELVTELGLTFPVVHDRGNVLASRYQVSELPITFVADRAGTIRWVADGNTDPRSFPRAVAAVKQPSP